MSTSESSNFPYEVVTEEDVPSPCIKACKINPETDLCHGCLRTLDEIIVWSKANNARKRQIWHLIQERKQAVGK